MVIFFFLALIGVLVGLAAYGISNVVYKRLVRAGNSASNTYRVLTFILSFLLLLFGIFVLVMKNIRLER